MDKVYFDFGKAIHFMKQGYKVARSGWNGKNMYIFLANSLGLAPVSRLIECNSNGVGSIQTNHRPVVCMKDAQDMIVLGWLASQTDMLADDWTIVE